MPGTPEVDWIVNVNQGCPRVRFFMSDSGKSLVGSMNRTRMICFPRLQVKSSQITGDSEILYITIAYTIVINISPWVTRGVSGYETGGFLDMIAIEISQVQLPVMEIIRMYHFCLLHIIFGELQ